VSAEDIENLTEHLENPALIYISHMLQAIHVISYNERTFPSYTWPVPKTIKNHHFCWKVPSRGGSKFYGAPSLYNFGNHL
jgi:hypothetical protein